MAPSRSNSYSAPRTTCCESCNNVMISSAHYQLSGELIDMLHFQTDGCYCLDLWYTLWPFDKQTDVGLKQFTETQILQFFSVSQPV